MTSKQWRLILFINILTILLVLSPFLPGPSLFSRITNLIFSFSQLVSIFGLIFIPIGLLWIAKQMKKQEKSLIPILLCSIPVIVFICSFWGSNIARGISRKIAINNTENLITALENYKNDKNQYPNDISSLVPKYLKKIPQPLIMGIPSYNYRKIEDNYIVTFTQNAIMGFNFEVVVYNPNGNHQAEGEIKTLYETGNPNWKYYIYD